MQRFPDQYPTILRSYKLILRNEGIRAFYVGMSSPLAGSAFSEALQFSVLRKIKDLMCQKKGFIEQS